MEFSSADRGSRGDDAGNPPSRDGSGGAGAGAAPGAWRYAAGIPKIALVKLLRGSFGFCTARIGRAGKLRIRDPRGPETFAKGLDWSGWVPDRKIVVIAQILVAPGQIWVFLLSPRPLI